MRLDPRTFVLFALAACGDSSPSIHVDVAPELGADATDSGAGDLDAEPDGPVVADVGDAVEFDVVEPDAPEADARDASADGFDDADADAASDTPADVVQPDVPDEPLGTIAGACGVVAAELDETAPSFFTATIDFGDDPFDEPADVPRLSAGAAAILEAGTAGGSSIYSEVFAYEILDRCDGAALLETERTIEYRPDHTGSITDFLIELDGERVGVSVTRAVGFPRDEPYTVDAATDLLEDKLSDVLESSAGVSDEDVWLKQVLVVMAYADEHVTSLELAFVDVAPEIAADTIVYVVESVGDDEWLY